VLPLDAGSLGAPAEHCGAGRDKVVRVETLTARQLLARTARAQTEGRLPSLVAGVARDGTLAWGAGRGRLDGAPDSQQPTTDTQYRIGSITKTFTAILVLRLRREGRLSLDDPLDKHVPGSPFGDRTVAQLLTHSAGLQAETGGPWWERTPGGPWDELVAGVGPDPAVFPAGRRFHYSNLGYGALGEVVARLRGRSWADVLAAEVLEPLAMHRTTTRPNAGAAVGLAVHPWLDLLHAEPEHDAGAMAPAGQLWSTARDLAALVRLLLGDAGDVLHGDDLAEMLVPGPTTGPGGLSYGLGVGVDTTGGRTRVGHGGSMPGFLASVLVDLAERTGAVVLANTTSGLDTALAGDLLEIMRTYEPHVAPEWVAAPSAPDALSLAGLWFWGPLPFLLTVSGDELRMAPVGSFGRAARFVRAEGSGGSWCGVDGYYAGETLQMGPDGRHLHVATFLFTREPYDPSAPVPGSVDGPGWFLPGAVDASNES